MKRALTFLCLFLLFGATTAQHGDPNVAAGEEQLEFQYALLPDEIFTDFRFFEIDEGAPTTNFSGVETVWIGGEKPVDQDAEQRVLFYVDISAIPDSAAIKEATLSMLIIDADAYAENYDLEFHVHRIMENWDGDATWTNRKAHAESLWHTEGCEDIEGQFNGAYGQAAAANNFGPPWNTYKAEFSDRPTRAGFRIGCGMDSLYSGYQATATQDASIDRTSQPDRTFYVTPDVAGTDANSYWVRVKLTDLVNLWHSNQILNAGALFKSSDAEADSMTFYSSAATGGKAPYLTIKYQFATSSGLESGITVIGAGTGTGMR